MYRFASYDIFFPLVIKIWLFPYKYVKSLQSCPILCDPMDCSPPGSSVHGVLQAKMLEWVAISSSRGFSQPRNQTLSLTSPAMAGEFFTTSTTWETPSKKKKAIGCLEGSFFIIQIQHSRGEMGGSCCRSQHGVGHTSPKSLQAMTRYLWGRAAGCTFPPGSRWCPLSVTALWSTDSTLSLEGRALYLQSPQVRKVVRGRES